jgi:hypothetical protein
LRHRWWMETKHTPPKKGLSRVRSCKCSGDRCLMSSRTFLFWSGRKITIDLLSLHELIHHCCPFPLSVPPPRTWRRSMSSNVIHSCRLLRSSQTDRLGGASSVPFI